MSGSLLAYFLPKLGHEVEVYESAKTPKVICGCGITTDVFQELAISCDLNPKSFILWKGKQLILKFPNRETKIVVINSCTFNKQKFLRTVIKNSEAKFHFGQKLSYLNYEKYDLVIDATGIRDCLKRLPKDTFFICYQVKATFKPKLPYPDFFIDFSKPLIKYLWMFPLSPYEAYVGCYSHKGKITRLMVLEFLNKFKGKILEERGKLVRLNSPQESLPFIRNNVVGVGNSIGAISSIGEGNTLSILTIKILLDNLNDLKEYQKKILEKLGWLKHDYAAFHAWTKNQKIKLLYHASKCRNHYQTRLKKPFIQALQMYLTFMKNRPPNLDEKLIKKQT
jgi:flavin-dependent dehydrogenase